MKELVKERGINPLIAGCLLAVIANHRNTRCSRSLDQPALAAFNKKTTAEVLDTLRDSGLVTREQASLILALDAQYTSYFRNLVLEIPEISDVTGCDSQAIERVARSLFSARLFSECVEILIAPDVSYEVTADAAIDLVAKLREVFRRVVAASWRTFFPPTRFGLTADAAAQFWVSSLDGPFPDQMRNSFIGVFRRSSRDRLLVLNHYSDYEKGMRLKDAVSEHIYTSQQRFGELHSKIESQDPKGVYPAFVELVNILAKLELPPIVARYYELIIHEVCQAFGAMDGRFSLQNTRYLEFLDKQLDSICCKYQETCPYGDGVEQIINELDQLVGLRSVKESVRHLARLGQIQQMRQAKGLNPVSANYNLIFTGNPSTGTTTVAKFIGRLYKSLGVLRKGHLTECDPSMLTGQSEIQTIARTNAVLDKALDGLLLVNDAAGLATESNEFAQEILSTLIQRMESNPTRVVVILTGFADQMEDFSRSMPRLKQSFPRRLDFPDYTPVELSQVLFQMCQRNNLVLSEGFRQKAIQYFHSSEKTAGRYSYNLQLVRQCFESVVEAQANRLASCGDVDVESLNLLEAEDLHSAVGTNGIVTEPNVRAFTTRSEVRLI